MDGKKNIISLIGMTGAGKSSVGMQAAALLGYPYYDLDEIIEEGEEIKIPIIFSRYGEKGFRETENKYLKKIFTRKHKSGIILSCGGGIVCVKKNVKLLVNNSFVVWIKRDICDIINDKGILERPPHNGSPDLYIENYGKREKLYENAADFIIENKFMSDAVYALAGYARSAAVITKKEEENV